MQKLADVYYKLGNKERAKCIEHGDMCTSVCSDNQFTVIKSALMTNRKSSLEELQRLFRGKPFAPKLTSRGDVGIFATEDIPKATLLLSDIPDYTATLDEHCCEYCLLPAKNGFACNIVFSFFFQ